MEERSNGSDRDSPEVLKGFKQTKRDEPADFKLPKKRIKKQSKDWKD
jgi:hypothetical protein